MEESDDETEDSASELPELGHVIESYLPSPSPPKKRRKVDATNPLNKPFKSPFRTPLKASSHSQRKSQILASPLDNNETIIQKSSPISTPSTISTVQRSNLPHPSCLSECPSTPGSEVDKLQKHHTQLLNTLASLRARLETTTQALKIEASNEDAELEGLIQKWKATSREAADEVFVEMKEKVDELGGWKKWKSTQAEGAGCWNNVHEENKICAKDDVGDLEEEGKEEKAERIRIEQDEKQQAENKEEEEDQTFTMETMLMSLDIPLELIGYDEEQQRWND
ncbi:MAG: hypothetical protein Q9168_002008 [Polycauliona sp. 1 TL-2023]